MSRRFSPKTRLDHHKGKQSRLKYGMNHPALLSCRVFRRKSERLSLFGSKQFRLNPRAISPPVTELRPLSIESESVVILRRNTELNLLSYKTARWVALHRKKRKKRRREGEKESKSPRLSSRLRFLQQYEKASPRAISLSLSLPSPLDHKGQGNSLGYQKETFEGKEGEGRSLKDENKKGDKKGVGES